MKANKFRFLLIILLLSIVAITVVIAISSSDTNPVTVNNSQVRAVTPTPGGLHTPRGDIVINLEPGLQGRLSIDGQIIPDDEIIFIPGEGSLTFRPQIDHTFEMFEAKTYSAEITFWPEGQREPSNSQTYSWDFKVMS